MPEKPGCLFVGLQLLGIYGLIKNSPVAVILVPDLGDESGYGVGLSYRPAKLHRLAVLYDNPTSFIPQSGTKNWTSASWNFRTISKG
jgi:hypothetical protein